MYRSPLSPNNKHILGLTFSDRVPPELEEQIGSTRTLWIFTFVHYSTRVTFPVVEQREMMAGMKRRQEIDSFLIHYYVI